MNIFKKTTVPVKHEIEKKTTTLEKASVIAVLVGKKRLIEQKIVDLESLNDHGWAHIHYSNLVRIDLLDRDLLREKAVNDLEKVDQEITEILTKD